MKKLKVLIIEDSKMMQGILSKIFSSDPTIEVVGIADDPLIARELIKRKNPDVLTLDIMLPHMDGITFLKNLMRLHPMPVVMVSTLTEKESPIALEALASGAVDYILKPTNKNSPHLTKFGEDLLRAVKCAAEANVVKSLVPQISPDHKLREVVYKSHLLRNDLIVIGASTGGVEAIEAILLQLPQVLPPVVIVQHIKSEFRTAFSRRMNKLYGLSVIEPEEGAEISPGNIYVPPNDSHISVNKKANHYIVELLNSPPVNGHKPSVDVLFKSAAKSAGAHTLGILLTGMGHDGAEGLKAIRDAGGATIAQDKDSSVVWGMPGAAVKMDAAEYIVSLNDIPQKILQIIDGRMMKVSPV